MHWRRKWQPTPVLLPGESQGRGSLVGCRLWGHTESDTTKAMQQHFALILFYNYVKYVHLFKQNILNNFFSCQRLALGFAWWSGGYDPPANVGDTGTISGPGRS